VRDKTVEYIFEFASRASSIQGNTFFLRFFCEFQRNCTMNDIVSECNKDPNNVFLIFLLLINLYEIAHAINKAKGITMRDLPLTPERLAQAVMQA
jgi:hypothetical protein